jgi:3-oxoadipate enol-lactonase
VIPVVFLHGIGGGAKSFAPQMASFAAKGYQPVALDLMGYGAREPVEAMSFEALAEDVEFAIGESGLERPVLLGHSMGGMVVQTMLRRRPEDYAAAVLSCTSPAFGNPAGDFQKKFVADRLAPLDAGKTMADAAPGAADNVMAPNADPAGRALFIEQYAAVPEATYRAAVKCLVTFDERANLANIKIPVLCLAAELDRNAPPPVLEKMAGKIPGAYYLCLPGLGHMPNLEAPAAFDAAIFSFLDHALARAS